MAKTCASNKYYLLLQQTQSVHMGWMGLHFSGKKDVYGRYLLRSNLANLQPLGRYGNGNVYVGCIITV